MSLYNTIYWTKRVFVALGLIIFICSGIRIFQFVSGKLTVNIQEITDYKPERGFGDIDKISFTALNTPPAFVPKEFINDTTSGNFDADNNYPYETAKAPLSYKSSQANVYKIIDSDKSIDINTTEVPRQIARLFNLTREPSQTSTTTQTWVEGNKKLDIDGQYLLVYYENNDLNNFQPQGNPLAVNVTPDGLKSYFNQILGKFGIVSDLESYRFKYTYVNYDKQKNDFVPSGNLTSGNFIRIYAERLYPNLFKQYKDASTNAVYPNYVYSNNYIILPTSIPKEKKDIDMIVRFSLYNWPLDQSISEKNKNVQTYRIKTPKQAFDELKSTNKYLISASEWDTRKPISLDELSGINKVRVFRIRIENYEDVVNTRYIQPIYVFTCQVEKNDKKIELIYYLPALI